jgi:GT2 family glycosyltransferase
MISHGEIAHRSFRIAAVLTCFNRREKTISALKKLRELDLPSGASLDIFLTDDGSTDGTAQAVKDSSLDVHLLHGNGFLFWGGGMRLAIAEAMKADFDVYLWLNDDTYLFQDAIIRLLETYESVRPEGTAAIIIGSICDPISGELTYGGSLLGSKLRPLKYKAIPPSHFPQRCDVANGNCVWVPRAIARAIGNISPIYTHKMGDFDYIFRARNAGFGVWIAPGCTGTCTANPVHGTWLDPKLPLRERWRRVTEKKGLPTREWKHFVKSYGGPLWFIIWFSPYCRTLFAGWKSYGTKWQLRRWSSFLKDRTLH